MEHNQYSNFVQTGAVHASVLAEAATGMTFSGIAANRLREWYHLLFSAGNFRTEGSGIFDGFYLLVPPRVTIQIGSSLSPGLELGAEGGLWAAYVIQLVPGPVSTSWTSGWYATGALQFGAFEKRFTIRNGSPNL